MANTTIPSKDNRPACLTKSCKYCCTTLPKVGRKHETIYQLIDTCKDLLSRKNVSEAKVFYNQIRERYYDKKFDSNKEKESIHNMIRSLYDEINLADIGTNM